MIRIFSTIIVASAMFFSANANCKTCAEKYAYKAKKYRRVAAGYSVFEPATLALSVGFYSGSSSSMRTANSLKSFSRLLVSATALQQDYYEVSHFERVKRFYEKYVVKSFPKTQLGLEEVIQALHSFNTHSVSLGLCKKFRQYQPFSFKPAWAQGSKTILLRRLFPNGKISTEIEETLAATQTRQNKNNQSSLFNRDYLSDPSLM